MDSGESGDFGKFSDSVKSRYSGESRNSSESRKCIDSADSGESFDSAQLLPEGISMHGVQTKNPPFVVLIWQTRFTDIAVSRKL